MKKIERAAFWGCNNLKLEKLTTNGRTIGNNAFRGVTIEEVEISESFVPSGYYTFQNAEINRVSFEEGIRVLPAYLFNECDSIEEIRLPGSVIEIGDSSFGSCTNLKVVEIPDSVKKIERAAFWGCNNLKTLEIPSSVNHIGRNAFNGCKNLTLSVRAGSYAEQYAIEEEVPYKTY